MTAIAIPRPSHLLRALRRARPLAAARLRRSRRRQPMFMAATPPTPLVWELDRDELTGQLDGRGTH